MAGLSEKRCKPCEGGMASLTLGEAQAMREQLDSEWSLDADGKSLTRRWQFKNFYRTMSFVNAVAHLANTEDHHPDLEVGYGYCRIKFTTHAIDGLSENDFICAAKIDLLPSQ
jgi:4a-hydroxytetrahydrobiopterin dehydratase